MVWLALVDPRRGDREHTPEELERVQRFQAVRIAERLGKWPHEVMEMDLDWWDDMLLFAATEAVAMKSGSTGSPP